MPSRTRQKLGGAAAQRAGGNAPEASGLIDLSRTESPWGPPAEVANAIASSIAGLNRYPDRQCAALCAKLAEFYGVEPDQIAVGGGSKALVQDLLATACGGGEVVFSVPCSSGYEEAAMHAGAAVVKVPLDVQQRCDLDALAQAITPHTRAVIVSNPHSPTGSYRTSAELSRFISLMPAELTVVIDEAYHEYERIEPLEASLELVRHYSNVAIVRSFSKAYGLAGLGIGYCIAHSDLAAELRRVTAQRGVSSPAQLAAAKMLEHETYRHIARHTAMAVSLRKRFEKGLRLAGIAHIPSSANFVTLLMDPKTGAARMRSAGVLVLPLEEPGGIRITIGTEEQMQQVCRTLGFELPGE